MRDCEVKLTSERREEAPRLFTHINLHFIVTGQDLTDKIVERAVNLSAEKYCSVALMLNKAATVTHSFEIRQPAVETERGPAPRSTHLFDLLAFQQPLHQRRHDQLHRQPHLAARHH